MDGVRVHGLPVTMACCQHSDTSSVPLLNRSIRGDVE
jgi:hypothetical protein